MSFGYLFDEGSGAVIYGYDKALTLISTATSATISQTASAVNSSIIFTGTYPLGNATDRYSNATGYSWRMNGTSFVFNLLHEFYDTFAVTPVGLGSVNRTDEWMPAGTPFGILATPYIGVYFQYWLRDGIKMGSQNPATIAATGAHTYQALFGTDVYVPSATIPDFASNAFGIAVLLIMLVIGWVIKPRMVGYLILLFGALIGTVLTIGLFGYASAVTGALVLQYVAAFITILLWISPIARSR
jgi:hypothetical protein